MTGSDAWGFMTANISMWFIFGAVVIGMLVIDLGVVYRRAHEIKIREALGWSAVWIAVALLFNAGIYLWMGKVPAVEFLTAYLVEKSLSVDNLFVFLLIFSYFGVKQSYQHKVLFWGIISALVFRAIFIATGLVLINVFHWAIYLFGAFLIFIGINMAIKKGEEVHPEKNLLVRLAKKVLPISKDYKEARFIFKDGAKWFFTPLFIVLLAVEGADIIFAFDSIPAVIAITRDPFIVYTSNIFAILGLRALYFALAGILKLLVHLNYGLAVILVFIGVKMLISDYYKIPTVISLGVIAAVLLITLVTSLLFPGKEAQTR